MLPTYQNYKDIILEIDVDLSQINDADILLERILLEARLLFKADAGTIYVKDGTNLLFKYSQNTSLEKRLPSGHKLPYANFSIPIEDYSIAGFCAHHCVSVRIDDAYALPMDKPYEFNQSFDVENKYKTKSIMTVPLTLPGDNLIGVLQLINALTPQGEVIAFPDGAEEILKHFAAKATTALQRALMTRSIVLRMNRMAELRDPKETGAHVNRVAAITAEVFERWAFKRGMPEKERDRQKDLYKMAALLHDVGKVAISDAILKKPAALTPEEIRVMQAHTCYGARLMDDPQSELDKVSAEVALHHHERWDGMGYPGLVDIWAEDPLTTPVRRAPDGSPYKLKGKEIPLGGRLVAIADVFDALSSKRSYKAAWEENRIVEEMHRLSGTHFDPEMMEAFFEVYPRIVEIRGRFPDKPD